MRDSNWEASLSQLSTMTCKSLCGSFEHLSLLVCFFLFAFPAPPFASASKKGQTVVKLDSGEIRGQIKRLPSIDGCSVAQFLGIPYAEPPTGELRFSAPRPVRPWKERRDARQFPARCPQNPFPWPFNHTVGPTSEDCLFMNVFAPSPLSENKALPVMVWIHGGGYYLGSGNEYDASVLAALNDVIVVTFNYRVGLLGFLNIPQTNITGNYGMLDQVEALKWVQRNIALFGGDPGRVTIFGESAGATSVTLHMLSPLSKGLFHQAVAQSGGPTSPFASFTTKDPKYGETFLKRLKCDDQSGAQALLNCLRGKQSSEFVTASKDLAALTLGSVFPAVTVDGHFLPDDPRKLLQEGKFHKVPFITGVNKDESITLAPLEVLAQFMRQNITRHLFINLVKQGVFSINGESELVKSAILYEYTNHAKPDERELIVNSWQSLVTESWFFAPSVLMAETLDQVGVPVYFYFFTHRSTFSAFPESFGVPHADDLMYVFGSPHRRLPAFPFASGFTDVEKGFSSFIMKLWTNFAKHGDPNRGDGNLRLPVSWPRYATEDPKYLNLDLDPKVEGPFFPKRVAFWNEFVPILKEMPRCEG